jgi:LysM repeat protein
MRQVWFMALVFILAVAVLPAQAQDNLLTNGSMEEDEAPYQGKGRGNLTVPQGWDIWLGQGEIAEGQFYNRGDKVYAFPHAGPEPQPASGRYAANIDGGYIQFNAALFQSASVAPGTALRAEAKSYVQSCNFGDAVKCASTAEFGSETRIGIDPNGGNDPNSGDIIWSSWTRPHDTWKAQSVEVTATGGAVTVFLYATQGAPTNRNMVYWDDAELTIGGSGGSNAEGDGDEGDGDEGDDDDDDGGQQVQAPAPPPNVVPFVSAQSARGDGSIVHTVREGETIDSIAVAYGTSRNEILALNPNLQSARFIQIGQRLTIREVSETDDDDDDDNGDEEREESTEDPTPIPGGVVAEDADLSVTEEVAPIPGAEDADGDTAESDNEVEGAVAVADASGAADAEAERGTTEGGSIIGSVRGIFGNRGGASDSSAAAPANAAMSAGTADNMAVEEAEAEMAQASEATPAPTPTEANELASVDITASTASVCVSLFEDLNQNRLFEDNESLLSGGAVDISQDGATVATYTTDGQNEPHCISELAPGNYIASMTPPTGYGMTTPTRLSIPLTSGTSLNIEFGAAQGVQVAAAPPDAAEELGNSADEVAPATGANLFSENIVAISGIVVAALAGVVVVAGIGATILLRRSQ